MKPVFSCLSAGILAIALMDNSCALELSAKKIPVPITASSELQNLINSTATFP